MRRFVFLYSVKAVAEPSEQCVDEVWLGEPSTPYGRAKRDAEDVVLDIGQRHGMHFVNLRLAMVYGRGGRGNLERMARGFQAGWFQPLPETGNRWSLVQVDDVSTPCVRWPCAQRRTVGRISWLDQTPIPGGSFMTRFGRCLACRPHDGLYPAGFCVAVDCS